MDLHPTYHSPEYLEAEVRQIVKDFRTWLFDFAHRYGYLHAIEHVRKHPDKHAWDTTPVYSGLRLTWGASYGCIDCIFHSDLLLVYGSMPRWQEYRVFNRGESALYPPPILEALYKSLDALCLELIPNVEQTGAVRFCAAGLSSTTSAILGNTLPDYCNATLRVCRPFGDQWVCDECLEKLTAKDTPAPQKETRPQQTERAKMTKTLRFQVMERDGFACRACGRNAREDGVKLHVDHIHPISKGGKTVPENLHTLCEDCNLGKSDTEVEQMNLWSA